MASQHSRRPSFGMLLRRSKSGEFGKAGKKAQALKEAELQRQCQNPPKLPEFRTTTQHLSELPLPTYGRASHDAPRAYVAADAPTVPPVPFDPYARTQSMTHRGRCSYASSAVSTINGPRRILRRKDPTPFNILVVGTRAAGKTSFVEFLKTAVALPAHKRPTPKPDYDGFRYPTPAAGSFIPHYLETEFDGERIGLTLWDSEGLERNVIDLQLGEISAFLETKFEDTFGEENKVIRSPGVQDTHIHVVFLILDPTHLDRNIAAAQKMSTNGYSNGTHASPLTNGSTPLGGLDEDMELQVLRTLHGKTTVIPVIAKADTITTKHMNVLKRAVWDSIKKANLDPLEPLGLDEETDCVSDRISEGDEQHAGDPEQLPTAPSTPDLKCQSSPSAARPRKPSDEPRNDEKLLLPLSVISPDLYEPDVFGRRFPWGFADPYNEQHCDFQRLKEAVFSEWRTDLREASRYWWYEGWRTNRLKQRSLTTRRQ